MKRRLHDYIALTKPRICTLAMVMTLFGYGMAIAPGQAIWSWKLVWAMIGIALVGASSGVLNQYIEKDLDAQMKRTHKRPLPDGRVSMNEAFWLGLAMALVGEMVLIAKVNTVTAALGVLTLFMYLALYTPSKRLSTFSTIIGAFPGAMPPLLGWTAATGEVGFEGLILFGILFIWQIPHFLAIGWLYRNDYSRANFPILTVVDSEGRATVKQIAIYSLVLLPFTLVAGFSGIAGRYYITGAAFLGLIFLYEGLRMVWDRSEKQAKRLFLVSIVYLPLLGLLMVWDRL